MPSSIQLIVGLGNPGPNYSGTRHNVGVWFVNALAEHCGAQWHSETKFHGLHTQIQLGLARCRLLVPMTFMNHSGRSVQAISHFYKIDPHQILVVHDELDFDPGLVRLKVGGGHGGHNGLRDIQQQLQTGDFQRVRLGIGHPGHKSKVSAYVLSSPPTKERECIEVSIATVMDVLPDILSGDFERAQQRLHQDSTI